MLTGAGADVQQIGKMIDILAERGSLWNFSVEICAIGISNGFELICMGRREATGDYVIGKNLGIIPDDDGNGTPRAWWSNGEYDFTESEARNWFDELVVRTLWYSDAYAAEKRIV